MKLGTKIYYCLVSGNIIQIIGDRFGFINETSFEEDINMYTRLNERNRETIGLLQFEYGEYPELSQGSTGAMVNLETKELIFSYEELPQEPIKPTEIEIMQNEIKVLREELTQIQTSIASLTSLIATTLEEK